jgi:hypothetical protein
MEIIGAPLSAVILRSETTKNLLSMEQNLGLRGTLLTGVAFMAKSVRFAQSNKENNQSGREK